MPWKIYWYKRKIGLINYQKPCFYRPYDSINQYKQQIDWLREKMYKEIEKIFIIQREKCQGLTNNLLGLSPNSVLNRDLVLLRKENNYISTLLIYLEIS